MTLRCVHTCVCDIKLHSHLCVLCIKLCSHLCVCVKVVLANSKRQGSVRDEHEDEKMLRLFIMIPTSFTDKDVKDEFTVCGNTGAVVVIVIVLITRTTFCGTWVSVPLLK